jgi:hypothetical protein
MGVGELPCHAHTPAQLYSTQLPYFFFFKEKEKKKLLLDTFAKV